jgi:hypothetical protein
MTPRSRARLRSACQTAAFAAVVCEDSLKAGKLRSEIPCSWPRRLCGRGFALSKRAYMGPGLSCGVGGVLSGERQAVLALCLA